MKGKHGRAEEKNNNSGFTLIEVLAAMVILAIMTLPILSAFASSAKINGKARKQENANALGQQIIEKFKGTSIEALTVGKVDADSTPMAGNVYSVKYNSGNYTFTMYNSTDAEGNPCWTGSNDVNYYVDVELSPDNYTSSTSNQVNSYKMPSFADVKSDKNVVIMEDVYKHESGLISSFQTLDSRIGDDDGEPDDTSHRKARSFKKSMKVQLDGSEVKYTITYEGTFHLRTAKYTPTTDPTTGMITLAKTYVEETKTYQLDFTDTSTLTDKEAVYIFYTSYQSDDEIEITNHTDIDVFFAEQQNIGTLKLGPADVKVNGGSISVYHEHFFSNVTGACNDDQSGLTDSGEESKTKVLYGMKVSVWLEPSKTAGQEFLQLQSTKEN